MVQCAALVETNHGIVNLIMNEYACYGKGHTIHSSGQIEWFKNSVDDRSVRVGKNIGQQYCWCSLMWLMPPRSLSNCDYELKNLPRLILGPIHSNQVMGTDPVGSYHGTRNSRSNSINPTYPYQSHD